MPGHGLDELNKSQVETQTAYLVIEVSLAERVKGKTKEIDYVLGEMATLTQAENTVGDRTSIVVEQSARKRKLQLRAKVQHRDEDDKMFPKESQNAINHCIPTQPRYLEIRHFTKPNSRNPGKALTRRPRQEFKRSIKPTTPSS
jgi:hypothetical protein